MDRFNAKNGSVVCRKLLRYDLSKDEDLRIIREENLFRTICPKLVRSAAEILDEMIATGIFESGCRRRSRSGYCNEDHR